MRRARSYIFAALTLAAAALALGYFLIPPPWQPTYSGPPEKVTIAYSAAPDAVLAVVAQLQGYYLREGLEATAHLHPFGKPALQEVLAGKADFATVAETPVMFAIMNGARLSLLATIQTAGRVNAIVARKDKRILTPSDLKGKRIAVTLGTTADYFMDTFLALHEIARKEVQVIDLQPEQMAEALARGEVDAVSVFMPIPIQVQKILGNRAITFYEENSYTSMFNVVATQKFVRKNPGKVKKLLRALVSAEAFVIQHPEQAQETVAGFCRIDAALVREVWPYYQYTVKLDQSLVLALEDETTWAVKEGLVPRGNMPNYLDSIYLEGLESIKPKGVRILR